MSLQRGDRYCELLRDIFGKRMKLGVQFHPLTAQPRRQQPEVVSLSSSLVTRDRLNRIQIQLFGIKLRLVEVLWPVTVGSLIV